MSIQILTMNRTVRYESISHREVLALALVRCTWIKATIVLGRQAWHNGHSDYREMIKGSRHLPSLLLSFVCAFFLSRRLRNVNCLSGGSSIGFVCLCIFYYYARFFFISARNDRCIRDCMNPARNCIENDTTCRRGTSKSR